MTMDDDLAKALRANEIKWLTELVGKMEADHADLTRRLSERKAELAALQDEEKRDG